LQVAREIAASDMAFIYKFILGINYVFKVAFEEIKI
jgi:hypothetical protein